MMTIKNTSPAEESPGVVLQCKPNPVHRILVADDESDIRQLNTEALTDSGYHVDGAEDGAVAWDILQLKRYHLLITDNEMPKVTGVELLKKIHAARIGVPVIMATGTLPQEQFARYPWIQPVAVLLKPYTLMELLGAVKRVMHTTSDARANLISNQRTYRQCYP
jgi:DNA-binding NtrC family response regulator